jgi:hypothetical protein
MGNQLLELADQVYSVALALEKARILSDEILEGYFNLDYEYHKIQPDKFMSDNILLSYKRYSVLMDILNDIMADLEIKMNKLKDHILHKNAP